MTIEEAIQQKKPFGNEYQRAMVNLIFTSNEVRGKLKQHLKPFGITMQQYNVLRILRGAGKPISTSIIRERLLDKMSDTSRMVERLVQKEWVQRCTCPNDKRLVDVTLSDGGHDLLQKLDEVSKGMYHLLTKLTEEEAIVLNQLLDKVRS